MAGQLLEALQALYHHPDPKIKDEADRYLEQWQQTVEAWSVADAVLHDPNSNMEAQYFCAQTLRTKVGFHRVTHCAQKQSVNCPRLLAWHAARGRSPRPTCCCGALGGDTLDGLLDGAACTAEAASHRAPRQRAMNTSCIVLARKHTTLCGFCPTWPRRWQVQRDFEELPPEAVNSLRESLLQLLIRYSK